MRTNFPGTPPVKNSVLSMCSVADFIGRYSPAEGAQQGFLRHSRRNRGHGNY